MFFAPPARAMDEIDLEESDLVEFPFDLKKGDPLPPAAWKKLEKKKASESESAQAPPSRVEDSYSGRIVDELSQYGYDMFAGAALAEKNNTETYLPAGAVQDEFVLNFGDRLEITFRGQKNESKVYAVNNDGMLIVDDLPPMPAAGKTIAQIREFLESSAGTLHNVQVFVSLQTIRQTGVLIVGHVKRPGRRTMTVFHTVLDALMAAGGVEKTGSLRQIKLIRDGRSTLIDLYALLLHGAGNVDMQLRDGDRIMVPPLGPTVAVSGAVKRPGIYEILPVMNGMRHQPEERSQSVSLNEMLELAGGLMSPGDNRYMRLGVDEGGVEKITEVRDVFAPQFGDGSILMVARGKDKLSGMVELTGHTRRPGMQSIDEKPTLSALLDGPQALGPDIYPLIGVIERWNEKSMAPEMLAFSPRLVLDGEFDRKLQDGDAVHLFSRKQILSLQKQDGARVRDVAYGSAPDEEDAAPEPVMVSFLKERSAFIRGAVRQPGAYPLTDGATLENLVAVSGGLTLEASTSNIEVTSRLQGENGQGEGRSGTERISVNYHETLPDSVRIGPGDSVRVLQKFSRVQDNSVQIVGEVANPGRYDLTAGDKLSDLIGRAGGLTEQAYPDGAIFSREGERKREEAKFRTAARDMERALAAAMDGDHPPDATQVAMARDLAAELKEVEAVGRITVEADPGMLQTDPELDILLESGDRVYIPKRPLTVRVNGEVLSPAALQFRTEKDPREYIMEAGGFTYHADKDRTFVLYPDGSAKPLQVSSWNHSATFIPPGSTIVVPRDPKPFDFIETAKDVSQILSNLAVTGIWLDDLQNDE